MEIGDIALGNHVMFKRHGVPDYELHWIVIGFYKEFIRVKIDEMGANDELYIEPKDITHFLPVSDTRYPFES